LRFQSGNSTGEAAVKTVYWHKDLPPLDGEIMHEHVIEATSDRVVGTLDRYGDLWNYYYNTLIEHVRLRIEQEISRLGGNYAHVLDEHIESHHDDSKGESWLHGRFGYVLFRSTHP
jgi:hypothetical protein